MTDWRAVDRNFMFQVFLDCHAKKTNSINFLGESMARQSAFGFIWPLVLNVKSDDNIWSNFRTYGRSGAYKSCHFRHSCITALPLSLFLNKRCLLWVLLPAPLPIILKDRVSYFLLICLFCLFCLFAHFAYFANFA